MEANKQIFSDELKVFFRLREPKSKQPTSLHMCLTINNKTYKLMTGVQVYAEQWNKKRQAAYVSNILTSLDNRNNEIVNNRISECKIYFNEFKDYLCNNLSAVDIGDISYLKEKIYIKKEKSMAKKVYANPFLFLQQIVAKEYKSQDGTEGEYQKAIRYIIKYCENKNIVLKDLNEITFDFLYNMREWLKEQISQRSKKDEDKLSVKYINNTISNVKRILEKIDDENIYNTNDAKLHKLKALKKQNTSDNEIALTEDEFERICNLELTGKEAKIRDAFIFQCCTGQRYVEVENFETAFTEIDTADGKIWQVIQKKGNKIVKVPISKLAKNILNKNNGIIKYGNSRIANETLKEIAKKAGLTQECVVTKDTSDGLKVHKKKRYELVTTHTARRSFVTISKQNDIEDRQVMSVTGHTTRTMLDLYNKVDAGKTAIKVASKLDDLFKVDTAGGRVEISKNTQKEKTKEVDNKELIDEAKRVLAFLGCDAITIADITNIDEANRLIYVEYDNKLTQMGIDYHIIKDLYNSPTTTLKEKKKALDKLVKEIKEKTSNKQKREKK